MVVATAATAEFTSSSRLPHRIRASKPRHDLTHENRYMYVSTTFYDSHVELFIIENFSAVFQSYASWYSQFDLPSYRA